MDKLETQVGKMETQLKLWGAKLDELKAKAKDATVEAKADYHKRVDELKAKHKAAQAKLDELKAAGSDKWETLKDSAETVWKEVEIAFKKLTN